MSSSAGTDGRHSSIWLSGPTSGFWLWYATLGGIGLWIAHLVSLAALADWSCGRPPVSWTMDAITIILAAATVAAGWLSVALVRERRAHHESDPDLAGRLLFLGLFGVLTESTSLLLIVWEGTYVPLLDACR